MCRACEAYSDCRVYIHTCTRQTNTACCTIFICRKTTYHQARLRELTAPAPEEHRRASADDSRRLESSLSMLSAGADRVQHLCGAPRAEIEAGVGPALDLLQDLRSLPEEADREEQRHRARRAARGETFEVCASC